MAFIRSSPKLIPSEGIEVHGTLFDLHEGPADASRDIYDCLHSNVFVRKVVAEDNLWMLLYHGSISDRGWSGPLVVSLTGTNVPILRKLAVEMGPKVFYLETVDSGVRLYVLRSIYKANLLE